MQLNYFLSTNPAAINPQFRDNMLAAGIAVASAGVNPSYVTTGTYDAVNNGKFPSHIKDDMPCSGRRHSPLQPLDVLRGRARGQRNPRVAEARRLAEVEG